MASQSGPTAGLRARLEAGLDRLLERPWVRRVDPWLGVSELRRFNPLIALIPVGVMALLGARTSQFGHMDTVGGIFPIIALISALNPFVGLVSGLAYGATDLVQKFLVDDIYYEGTETAVDYWGARVGYLVAYSSLIIFGTLPGILARVGARIGEQVAARVATGGATVAEVSPKTLRTGRVVGGAAGGIIGGGLAAAAYQATAAPAFVFRATPDHSCYILSRANVRDAIPAVMLAAGAGGGVAVLPPESVASDAQVGGRPDQQDQQKRCDELRARKAALEGRREQAADAVRTCGEVLQRIRVSIQKQEADHTALMDELGGVLKRLGPAAALTAGVLGGAIQMVCQRIALMYSNQAIAASGVNPRLSWLSRPYPKPLDYLPRIQEWVGPSSLISELFVWKFRRSLIVASAEQALWWQSRSASFGALAGMASGAVPVTAADVAGLLNPLQNRLIQEHLRSIERSRELEKLQEKTCSDKKDALNAVDRELSQVNDELRGCS